MLLLMKMMEVVQMMVMVMMLVVKITWLVNSQSVMTPQEVSGPTNISGALRQNFAKYFNSFTKGSIISTENHHQELKITQINIVIERNTVNSRINLSLTSSRSTRVRGKKKGWKAVAHGCTIFPCYLGMEIYAMQRPNE